MNAATKLVIVKSIHTLIWLFFNVVIFYFLYAVVTNRLDKRVWICISLIAAEGLVLLVFRNTCPVTILARNYTQSQRENFDIFLPNWLAKYNKRIYTGIVFVGLLILAYRLVQ